MTLRFKTEGARLLRKKLADLDLLNDMDKCIGNLEKDKSNLLNKYPHLKKYNPLSMSLEDVHTLRYDIINELYDKTDVIWTSNYYIYIWILTTNT